MGEKNEAGGEGWDFEEMENLSASEEGAFLAEDVNNIIKESIDSVLLNTSYVHTEVGKWTSEVVEGCLKRLTGLNKPFKYVGTLIHGETLFSLSHTRIREKG